MAHKPIISIRDLNVTYLPGRSNEVKALQGITIDILPGEYIIFFGPSGCGKSTLLYSIAGLERNVSGDIIVQDKNLAEMNQHQLEEYHQTAVGMIFQSFYLISSLTVQENVALPQVAIRKAPAERLARAQDLLSKFGVIEQASKLPSELSGGQQQRVAICRSIMNDPSIVIADEPVGNLDSKSAKDVMDLLRHLNDVEKKTVILVTHDPSHLNHAHRIFFLRDGKVIDTKVNTAEERAQAVATSAMLQNAMKTMTGGSHAAEAAASNQISGKAHEIFAEAVVGMSAEEMAGLEGRIQKLVQSRRADRRSILSFLARAVAKGGIGMERRKAAHVAEEIVSLIREIRHAQTVAKRQLAGHHTEEEDDLPLTVLESRILRRYLLDRLDIRLPNDEAVHAVDVSIQKHLEGSLNRVQMQRVLCLSARQHGGGLTPRVARRLARHIELVVEEPSKNGPGMTDVSSLASPPPPNDESQ